VKATYDETDRKPSPVGKDDARLLTAEKALEIPTTTFRDTTKLVAPEILL